MTELSEQNRQDLIKYRIDRANETIKESELLASDGYYNAAVSRLYYACYYATLALMLKHKLHSKTHTGIKTLLNQHFVATGILPMNIGKTFSQLFNKRQTSDYDDFVLCDKEMTDELTIKAKEYIDCLIQLINN